MRATHSRAAAFVVCTVLAVLAAPRVARAQSWSSTPAEAAAVARAERERGAARLVKFGATVMAVPHLFVLLGSVEVFASVASRASTLPGRDGAFASLLLVPVFGPLACQLIWPQPDYVAATLALDGVVQLGGALLFGFGVADLVRVRSASARGRRAPAPSLSFTPVTSPMMHGAVLTLGFE